MEFVSDSEYLNKLADRQDAAASAFTAAGESSAGLGDAVQKTHGWIFVAAAEATHRAEAALQDAAKSMAEYSAELATDLRSSAGVLDGADEVWAQRVRMKM